MSRHFSNKNVNNKNVNNNVNSRKPFCKVCADAGKTDTAHFPRKTPDPNSEVVCPTLLALECRYCFKNGHTFKYCVVLKDRKNFEEQERREHDRHVRQEERRLEQDRLARAPPVVPKTSAGKFTAFLEENEEEERQEEQQRRFELAVQEATAQALLKKEAEFPSFVSKKAPTIVTGGNNWAAMASNAALLAVPKKIVAPVLAPAPVLSKVQQQTHWADDSEDEMEQDDDDDVVASVPTSNAPCYARSSWDDNDW